MSGATGLDIRLPIGGLFTVLGLLVGGYGLATGGDPAHYEASLGREHQPVVGAGDARFRAAAPDDRVAGTAAGFGSSRGPDAGGQGNGGAGAPGGARALTVTSLRLICSST